jgi:hypothetical protein
MDSRVVLGMKWLIGLGRKLDYLLRDLAAIADGKGGDKPYQARSAARDRSKLEEIKSVFAGLKVTKSE